MKQHRGSVLLTTLIFFVFATTALFAILQVSITQQRSTANMVALSTLPYTCQTVADVAVDATLETLCTSPSTTAYAFVGDTTDVYNQGLEVIVATVPLELEIDTLIGYQGLSPEAETALLEQLSSAEISIAMQSSLEIQPNSNNVLGYADGDFAKLKPLTIEVTVQQGMTTVCRTYEVDGLVATFRHIASGIYTTVQQDGATISLVAQTVT
ncbi:hypothetical protein RFF05_17790 [Bengtsoniella intestinalis]|uniref:hypothetical protein n=1 Tax=Bengtsoniella intestinalis TaxID=3073143 RepID=UPI00391F5C4E